MSYESFQMLLQCACSMHFIVPLSVLKGFMWTWILSDRILVTASKTPWMYEMVTWDLRSSFSSLSFLDGEHWERKCSGLMFRSTWSPLGHFFPTQRTPFLMMTSIVYKINCHDCDASSVGETGRALNTHMSEHRRAVDEMDLCSSTACMGARPSHRLDKHVCLKIWTSLLVRTIQRAIYICRQPSSLNRDRGTLPDMYDFIIIVIALHHLEPKPYNCRKWSHMTMNPRLWLVFLCLFLICNSALHWCKVTEMSVLK